MFEIQHDILFWRISSVRQLPCLRITDRTHNRKLPPSLIQPNQNFATFHCLYCPQFTRPTHAPAKQS